MRAVVALLTSLIATLALAASVGRPPGDPRRARAGGASTCPGSGLSVGVNDDAGKFGSLRDWFYPAMNGDGLTREHAHAPLGSRASRSRSRPGRRARTRSRRRRRAGSRSSSTSTRSDSRRSPTGSAASRRPTPRRAATASGSSCSRAGPRFVASAFPSVHQFVVMNECNQPLFLNPQWDAPGRTSRRRSAGARSPRPTTRSRRPSARTSSGASASPRAETTTRAPPRNSSTSPVRFLGYLGAWFQAFAAKTHRTAPLMDGLDFHPYPVPQSLPFATGYTAPKDASVDQPAPHLPGLLRRASPARRSGRSASRRGGGLPVSLNETGIQTAARGDEYDGLEVSATPAGGVLGQWATQAYQAKLVPRDARTLVACDPNVRVVNIFHLLDETDLTGWQSGLYFADQSPKLSAVAVRTWIASTGATCRGKPRPWEPGSPGIALSLDLSKLRLPAPPKVVAVRAADVARAPVAVPVEPLPALPLPRTCRRLRPQPPRPLTRRTTPHPPTRPRRTTRPRTAPLRRPTTHRRPTAEHAARQRAATSSGPPRRSSGGCPRRGARRGGSLRRSR